MKRSFLFFAALVATISLVAQEPASTAYWNNKTQIIPLRMPLPPTDYEPEFIDLNGDRKQDAVKSIILGNIPVLWLDDDGNMKEGDIEGDTVNDCLLVDRNEDGIYDFVIKHADLNNDGRADIQFIFDYCVGKGWPRDWNYPHYMIVIDDDNDGVFNYVNWNEIVLRCWEKNGLSDFYTDYSGNTTFIKAHRSTLDFDDLRYNWENPFIFYDYDNDGLTEIALRFCDTARKHPESAEKGYSPTQYDGWMSWFSLGIDMDNDNAPGNDFDFDMTLHYKSDKAFAYHDQVHKLKNMRGLPEADKFFPDPRVRHLTELIYPDRDKACELAFAGEWQSARFCYDEDDDCGRWERVELYDDMDAFKIGRKNGGVDNHTQNDPAGDRGEWDRDFSGNGDVYIGRFDGRIHLYGAERGVWRIDQNTKYYQGWDRRFQNSEPTEFATVEYLDTDENGFLDLIKYDLDGDCKYEIEVSLKELGIDDRCDVIDVSEMKYKDYTKLFDKVSRNMWKQALAASAVAEKYGLELFWYNRLRQPLVEREFYHDGYWLQFYIFKDLEYKFLRDKNSEMLAALYKAYYSGNWKSLL